MVNLTEKEAIATVEAINTMLSMLGDLVMQTDDIKDAIKTLEQSKSKIKSIYKGECSEKGLHCREHLA